ncbi:hypothetical protein X636_17615 [Pandoraea pnomenusa]|nr:hypothetical protein X636_17615 [Pandoraea pnomenusa]
MKLRLELLLTAVFETGRYSLVELMLRKESRKLLKANPSILVVDTIYTATKAKRTECVITAQCATRWSPPSTSRMGAMTSKRALSDTSVASAILRRGLRLSYAIGVDPMTLQICWMRM